jgi:hypothetical protein
MPGTAHDRWAYAGQKPHPLIERPSSSRFGWSAIAQVARLSATRDENKYFFRCEIGLAQFLRYLLHSSSVFTRERT